MKRLFAGLLLAPFAACVAGCFALVNVDQYHSALEADLAQGGGALARQYDDLKVTLATMRPHAGHMLELFVVDANNLVQSRAIVKAMTSLDVTLTVPRAVPRANAPHRLDFYADVNHSGGFDGLGSVVTNDHAWRIEPLADFPEGAVPHVDGTVQITFVHNTSFTSIDQWPSGTRNPPGDTGLPARVRVSGIDMPAGRLIQARVADKASGHVVGLYRSVTDGPEATFVVPGSVDVASDYDVDVYIDANGDGRYDNPAAGGPDLGFRAGGTSTAAGLDVAIEAPPTEWTVDVGAP